MKNFLHHRFRLFAVLCGALVLVPAMAERADRNKPMVIESDSMRYDDLKQVSSFTGRVLLTKGSILVRGARIDTRQDADGYQFGTITAEPGQRAFFRQKREGVDEFMEGEAKRIEYDGRADTVKFFEQAVLRRFKGATLNDEMNAAMIFYDNTTEVFTMQGQPSAGSGTGRVRAMLTPRETAAPAPAAPASLPLRTSPGLGGVGK